MSAEWFLVQYSDDLRRHEPRNIGVVLSDGNAWHVHFRAVDEDGHVNGHALRSLNISKDVYQSWVKYFRRKATPDGWTDALKLQLRRPTNFSVVRGGILFSSDANWATESKRLFHDLVDVPERPTKSAHDLAKDLFARAGIVPEEKVSLLGRWDDGGVQVEVPFDYSVHSGKRSTLEALGAQPMAVASLKARLDAVARVMKAPRFIAMVPLGRFDSAARAELVRPVENSAWVLDLDRPDAVTSLREMVDA